MNAFTQPIATLFTFSLKAGAHQSPAVGVCAMEAVAWMAGEKHSDKPECACPVLGAFTRRINDSMGGKHRPLLNPLILSLIGTRSAEHETPRAAFITRNVIRRLLPIAYDAAGLHDMAARLRSLPADAPLAGYRDAASYAAIEAASYAAIEAASDAASDAASYAASDAASYATSYAARAASEAACYAASYAASDAASEAASGAVWSEAVQILSEAIAIGPHNTGTLNGTPVFRRRLESYRADVVAKSAAT